MCVCDLLLVKPVATTNNCLSIAFKFDFSLYLVFKFDSNLYLALNLISIYT